MEIYEEKEITKKQFDGTYFSVSDPMVCGIDDDTIDFCTFCGDSWAWLSGAFKNEREFYKWFERDDDNLFNMNVQYTPKENKVVMHLSFQSDEPMDDRFIMVKGAVADKIKQLCIDCVQKEDGMTCEEFLEESK